VNVIIRPRGRKIRAY